MGSTLEQDAAPTRFRLPEATRVGLMKLQVADLERSILYYENVIGFRVLTRGPSSATLGPFDDATPLVELHEHPGATPVPRRGRLGLYHFAILLPDRTALGRFARHLPAVGVSAGMSDHAVSEALYLTDPDGLGIEVYADRPRDTWQYDGRQLVMTTVPLDVESLLKTAGSEPWKGMPVGTTIGHVHLFVGDLARATSFYHDGLGFDKIVWGYPGALFLSAGGYHHHLGVNTWAVGAAPPGENDARLLEWEVVLPTEADVEAALGSMTAVGATIEHDSDGAVARDPWGTAVRVRVDR